MAETGTHYRAGAEAPVPAGVYRVVGLEEGRVALLRVADDEGARVHTGAVERVDADALAALEPADAPATSLVATLASGLLAGFRQVPRNVRARPVQSGLGAALVVVAAVGPSAIQGVPAAAFVVANVLGAVLVGAAAAGIPRSG